MVRFRDEYKEIMHMIALEEMISEKLVHEIVSSQFELMRKEMESGNREDGGYKNVRLINFGLFYFNELKAAHINRMADAKASKEL
jgi:nucleoid DNA-binding protein